VNQLQPVAQAGVWDRILTAGFKGAYDGDGPDDRLVIDPRPSARRQRQKKATDPVAWVRSRVDNDKKSNP